MKIEACSLSAELWAVVNNAGLAMIAEIEWCSVDSFQKILDVNVLGVVRVTKAFLPLLRHSKGRVINVSSLAGIHCLYSYISNSDYTRYVNSDHTIVKMVASPFTSS